MADLSNVYEKLGAFYLGKQYDVAAGQLQPDLILYDSKDLVTHAVCVGMTGSGKTGLGVTLLEEAAIDGIPSLVIDPKGDLTNLLLNFPTLAPAEFARWVNPDDARREGLTVEEYAARQASLWKNGLADWHQGPERIARLAQSCEFNIFTPGSDAGIPVSILASFEAPPPSVTADADLLRDRISTTATSLLTLLGLDADPIRSREHILLTTILDECWRKGVSLDLGSLIQMVQKPPVTKIGVMDIESFFAAKDRFELAMVLNNLLAAPGFAAWLTGESMNVDGLLFAADGRPRVSIFYIAHLSEPERMFFMALLLNQVLSWMRSRPGTTSLRALLYIDEIFGYMPPIAEPPTKKPLLTLLKQARAYGLGLVLATQNPVDLDYKGLSNAGTWFLGRLQTERDKQRVLDGLEGAVAQSGGRFDRHEISEILSRVGQRVFLMHNVHESHPVTFQTRWALSYLAGPMTRTQIRQLMEDKKKAHGDALSTPAAGMRFEAAREAAAPVPSVAAPPILPPEIPQVFLPLRRAAGAAEITYEPRLLAMGKVHFVDTRKNLSADQDLALLASLDRNAFGLSWDQAVALDLSIDELEHQPPLPGSFQPVPSEATQGKSYSAWQKQLEENIYRAQRYQLFRCKPLDAISEPGETEREFRIRLSERAREQRDDLVEGLRRKYAVRLAAARERVRKAQLRVEREAEQASGAKFQSIISTGAAVLSMVLGGRKLSSTNVGRAATAARGHGRARTQADDVRRAESDVDAYADKLDALQEELQHECEEIERQFDVERLDIDELLLKPRKADINIRYLALAWAPFTTDSAGRRVPLF